MHDNAQANPQNPPGHVEKDTLPGVEAHEAAPVVGLEHEKDDRRDDGEIGQHAGHIVSESRGSDGGDNRAPTAPGRAGGCPIRNLFATQIAKCPWISPSPSRPKTARSILPRA